MSIEELKTRNANITLDFAISIFSYQNKIERELRETWLERIKTGASLQEVLHEIRENSNFNTDNLQNTSQDSISIADSNLDFQAGLKRKLNVKIKNNSSQTYQTTPEEPLFACYHWFNEDGSVYEFDGVRTPLAGTIEPDNSLEMAININSPLEPGNYHLMVTMVYEGRHWMEEVGLNVSKVLINVQDYEGSDLTRQALSVFKQLHAAEMEASQ
ncbi:hypothetical protein GU3_14735 [Oceanimonas sp. GK1]|uniref:hypothetical protein n=1 Tax=Oceanimonas sp. (strain GK1 / IBRC-M 10197) TaxID=511062 RepID=UPI000249508E|nr:hypothetical protein [Oceanimonas sp. GK1]AEY02700.1 hypothetical protein GU3_14735 [Oceanimonas sp. GK1]